MPSSHALINVRGTVLTTPAKASPVVHTPDVKIAAVDITATPSESKVSLFSQKIAATDKANADRVAAL